MIDVEIPMKGIYIYNYATTFLSGWTLGMDFPLPRAGPQRL